MCNELLRAKAQERIALRKIIDDCRLRWTAELQRLQTIVKQDGLLNELAAECHQLATARNKYRTWSSLIGRNAIRSEVDEWYAEASYAEDYPNAKAYHHEEYGDILHAVLSVGHQMGYDIDAELAAAMKRNAERAEGGKAR